MCMYVSLLTVTKLQNRIIRSKNLINIKNITIIQKHFGIRNQRKNNSQRLCQKHIVCKINHRKNIYNNDVHVP